MPHALPTHRRSTGVKKTSLIYLFDLSARSARSVRISLVLVSAEMCHKCLMHCRHIAVALASTKNSLIYLLDLSVRSVRTSLVLVSAEMCHKCLMQCRHIAIALASKNQSLAIWSIYLCNLFVFPWSRSVLRCVINASCIADTSPCSNLFV
jgi:hypothetical protein